MIFCIRNAQVVGSSPTGSSNPQTLVYQGLRAFLCLLLVYKNICGKVKKCAIVSHCVRVGKDSNAKSNNTDNTSEKEKADMAYNKAISDFAKSNDAKAGENSDFMAELKSVAKTPEEVDMIKRKEEIIDAEYDAKDMLTQIKRDIMIKAKNAKYNSSGKIVAYGDFSRDYVSHNSYGYIIKNENKFKYLIDDLCRLAALDGIKVEKIVAKDSRTGLKYDFPCETLSGFMLDYCNLVVKCSCTIPQSTFDE